MAKTDTVHDAIVPVVEGLGLDLYDLELNRGILRISLTKVGGITIDELAKANNAIGAKLDDIDPFTSRYTLEVSSSRSSWSLSFSSSGTWGLSQIVDLW